MADRLVREALADRRARQAHLVRARRIVEQRLASPRGLALCFGVGAVAGLRLGRSNGRWETGRAGGGDEAERTEKGRLRGILEGPIGFFAARLAAATIVETVRSRLGSSAGHGDAADAAPEEVEGAGTP